MTTTTIRRAETCIHGHENGSARACHPCVIVPADVLAAASAFKRAHWHEIPDVGAGSSDTIPPGELRDALAVAYAAADPDGAGALVWLRTEDYAPPLWHVNPDYRAWLARWDALETPEQRRTMREREPAPPAGHWTDRRGDCTAFLTRDRATGALRFEG